MVQETEAIRLSREERRLIRTCQHKLRHLDSLAAMKHARELASGDLLIYPCPVCDGLHVGHEIGKGPAKKAKQIRSRLVEIEKRIAALRQEQGQLLAQLAPKNENDSESAVLQGPRKALTGILKRALVRLETLDRPR
jgi:uncharacterized small protein (DUF1192 family)